jgi:hypothetical protein
LLGLILLVVWIPNARSKAASEAERKDLVNAANQWKAGEPISFKLLEYKPAQRDGYCFPWPDGTEMLFGGITNYAFFKAVLERPATDLRILTNALGCGLRLVGPNRFFTDALAQIRLRPELVLESPAMTWIKAQAAVKHVFVDSLYISFARMKQKLAAETLDQIRSDLQRGTNWDRALRFWSWKLEYKEVEPRVDGRKVTLTLSRIGNLGDFILPQNENPLFSFREDWMPRAHKQKLLAAKTGDILILFDKEDLSSYADLAEKETGERLVLHRIREVWDGLSN